MPQRRKLSDRLKRLDLGRRNLEFSLDSFARTGDRAALLHLATELRAQVYTHGQSPLLLQLAKDLGVPLKIYGPKPGFLDALQQITGSLKFAVLPDSFEASPGEGRPWEYDLEEWLNSVQAIVDDVRLTPMQIIGLVAGKNAAHFAPSIPAEMAAMAQYNLGGLPGFEGTLVSTARMVCILDDQLLEYKSD